MLRSIYDIGDADTAAVFVAQLGVDFQDDSCPPEVRRLGRTIIRWQHQIAAWHRCHHTNAPTEAIIIWSPVWGVVHVVDDEGRDRGGRVIWSDVVMVAGGATRVG